MRSDNTIYVCYGLFAEGDSEPFYIGHTKKIQDRISSHRRDEKIKKYGPYGFMRQLNSWSAVVLTSSKTRKDAIATEQRLINDCRRLNVYPASWSDWREPDSEPMFLYTRIKAPSDSYPLVGKRGSVCPLNKWCWYVTFIPHSDSDPLYTIPFKQEAVMAMTSRQVASKKNVTHEDIMKLVKNHDKELTKMGKVQYRTGKVQTKGGPQDTRYAMLNPKQAHYLSKLTQPKWEGK